MSERICAVCTQPFTSRRKDTRTCSKACWRALYRQDQQSPSIKRQARAIERGKTAVRRRRDAQELLENDRKAVQLHFAGADIGTIRHALGYDTWAGAQAALNRGMKAYRSFLEDVDNADMLAFEVARCDWEIRHIAPAILNPGPKVAPNGKIIHDPDTGKPVPDWDVKIKALNTYDKIAERMTKLKGVVPEKAAVTVVPVTHVVQGIAVEELR